MDFDDIETLDNKMNEAEGSFLIEFEDGYNFKNLVEYLKNTNLEGNFIITKNSLSYAQSNSDNTIFNQIDFDLDEFGNFQFDSQSDKIVVGFTLSDLRSVTTTIGKHDKLIIYKKSDDDKIHLKIEGNSLKKNPSAHNAYFISPIQVKIEKCTASSITETKKPNQNVSSSEFCKMCTALSKSKCSVISIQGFPNGIKFESITEGGILGKSTIFGQLPGVVATSKITEVNGAKVIKLEDNNIYPKIKIDIEIIKKLSKLNNISLSNKLRLFVGDNLFAITSHLGSGNGKLTINIKSSDD